MSETTPPERPPKRGRIGRPPKVDEHGTPTRDRLLRAAAEACVEFGYEGATLADIARRAGVSTPAVYSHFDSKADLLVEASKNELDKISSGNLLSAGGLRELARAWLQPDFARSRILVSEIHCAAIRQPEVAACLAKWQDQTASLLQKRAGLSPSEVTLFYILLVGAAHVDEVASLPVTRTDLEDEITRLIEGWFGDRYR